MGLEGGEVIHIKDLDNLFSNIIEDSPNLNKGRTYWYRKLSEHQIGRIRKLKTARHIIIKSLNI
jgi:hypothetical protein